MGVPSASNSPSALSAQDKAQTTANEKIPYFLDHFPLGMHGAGAAIGLSLNSHCDYTLLRAKYRSSKVIGFPMTSTNM